MIIGVSGHIHSGKDEIGKVIQYLFYLKSDIHKDNKLSYETFDKTDRINNILIGNVVPEIKKFADTLKDIICLLTGCTREQLENEDFKNSKLSNEWDRWFIYSNFNLVNTKTDIFFATEQECKNYISDITNRQIKAKEELAFCVLNVLSYKKESITYRELLQYVGTDLFRNQLHKNVWLNTLMSKYKAKGWISKAAWDLETTGEFNPSEDEYPNWIITDCRFENEAKVIKDKGGIIIRVNRLIGKRVYIISNEQPFKNWYGKVESYNGKDFYNIINGKDDVILVHKNQITLQDEHESEVALDDYEFDYVIDNNDTIEELILRVKEILQIEKII